MSTKTRYFVAISGAILAIGLGTGLVASYMGLPVSVFSRAAGPEELQYVPANAAVVAYANIRDLMDSEFRQRFKDIGPTTEQKNEFEEKTGLNFERDIDSVVIAVTGSVANQPHTVYVRGADPRALARRFLVEDDVLSMKFESDAVVVETARPDSFYARLTELAASGEAGQIDEVQSPDDNLQAVFKYLVKQ